MGILLLCIVCSQGQQEILVTVLFSILILMKHLFVPFAPIFGCVILNRIFKESDSLKKIWKVIQHAAVALANLVAAFGPFVYFGGISELQQIFLRLFPFGRGLVHAYWAPNFWAMYIFFDKALMRVLNKLGFNVTSKGLSSSSGKVGVYTLAFFPQIQAWHCLLLVVVLTSVPSFLLILRNSSLKNLLRTLVFSTLSSFMFGYHVHEKAIMIPLLIQTLSLYHSPTDQLLYHLLNISSIISLFPLLPGDEEWIIKGTFVFILLTPRYSFSPFHCFFLLVSILFCSACISFYLSLDRSFSAYFR